MTTAVRTTAPRAQPNATARIQAMTAVTLDSPSKLLSYGFRVRTFRIVRFVRSYGRRPFVPKYPTLHIASPLGATRFDNAG
jgi:hypothetical protein